MKKIFKFSRLILLLIPYILIVGCQPKNNFSKMTTYSMDREDVISISNRNIVVYQNQYLNDILEKKGIQLGLHKGKFSLEKVPFSGFVSTYLEYNQSRRNGCFLREDEYIDGKIIKTTIKPEELVYVYNECNNWKIDLQTIKYKYENEDDLYISSAEFYTNCSIKINEDGFNNYENYTGLGGFTTLKKIEYNEYDSEMNLKRDNGQTFPIKIKEENYFPCEDYPVSMEIRIKKLDSIQIFDENFKIPHYSYE